MTTKTETVKLDTRIPYRLFRELQALVEDGWSRDLDDVVIEALRRYSESHRDALMAEFIREDVEWGLRGRD